MTIWQKQTSQKGKSAGKGRSARNPYVVDLIEMTDPVNDGGISKRKVHSISVSALLIHDEEIIPRVEDPYQGNSDRKLRVYDLV